MDHATPLGIQTPAFVAPAGCRMMKRWKEQVTNACPRCHQSNEDDSYYYHDDDDDYDHDDDDDDDDDDKVNNRSPKKVGASSYPSSGERMKM
jgi:hypothetical protein